jgi:DUF1680 family protein
MSNHADVTLGNKKIKVEQSTSYPWNGKVKLTVNPEKDGDFTVKMRVPGWARNEVLPGGLYTYLNAAKVTPTLSVNGKKVAAKIQDGYFIIKRNWKKNDVVDVDFPMEVREVKANEKIVDDRGKISLEYGPIVYAVEEADNKLNFDGIGISANTTFKVKSQPAMLKGIYTIEGSSTKGNFTAIPYYSWSNRGIGKMKVWLPVANK